MRHHLSARQVCARREGLRSNRGRAHPVEAESTGSGIKQTSIPPPTNRLTAWSATTLHSSKDAILREGHPWNTTYKILCERYSLELRSSVAFWVTSGKGVSF